MRDRPTSIVSVKPSAAGITWNSSCAATPIVVHSHITALATVANIASGTGRPGFSRFQSRIATSIRSAPDPGGDDDQHEPDVEERARHERRIEGEEHRRPSHRDRDDRDDDADDGEPERAPRPRASRQRPRQRSHGDEIAEAHDEERRQHVGHRDAVRRDRHEIELGRSDLRAERAAHPHLPRSRERRRQGTPRRRPRNARGKAAQRCAQEILPWASGFISLSGMTWTVAHISLWPSPQYSWHGISRSPVLVNSVCTCET